MAYAQNPICNDKCTDEPGGIGTKTMHRLLDSLNRTKHPAITSTVRIFLVPQSLLIQGQLAKTSELLQ